MKHILFLCTSNSCRSQMAEGWAKHLFGDKLKVSSAGSDPTSVNPRAIEVMAEVGIDISAQHSKSAADFRTAGVDLVFTLCGDAREKCPIWPGAATIQHQGFDDPPALAKGEQSVAAELQHYRRVRDEIGAWIKRLEKEWNAND